MPARPRKLYTIPRQQGTGAMPFPAPVGGINSINAARGLPPTDALQIFNLIPYRFGLRVRSGWREWATGVGITPTIDTSGGVDSILTSDRYAQRTVGATDQIDAVAVADSYDARVNGNPYRSSAGAWNAKPWAGPRTLIAFNGSNPSAGTDRLFAVCEDGIYDVSRYGNETPEKVFSFPVMTYPASGGVTVRGDAKAGFGVYTSFANDSGQHFCAYADGAWGYFLYSEVDDVWRQVIQLPDLAWTASTAYALGTLVNHGGAAYEVVAVTGTALSGATGPSGSGNEITDNEVTWRYVPAISGIAPGDIRFVMSWKNRLWFALNNSSTAYYLPINQFAGAVNPVYFGSRFRYGGNLVGLWSWTMDGGAGIDDLLVGISASGDVVVYEGYDPATPGAFALRGVWWVGPVPPGRGIATDFGGDLFILSRVGCLPLSKLVAGGLVRDPGVYETGKVSNIFNALMTERGDQEGWALKIHPADNLLIINVPAMPSKLQQQLAMSMATKGWTQLLNVPIQCMETWKGRLYFGTYDNRVCTFDGATDGVRLDGTGSTDINYALLTSYQDFGSVRKKRCHMVRPIYSTSDGAAGFYTAEARFDFDMTDVDLTAVTRLRTTDTWGTAIWGTSLWRAPGRSSQNVVGSTGLGSSLAVLLRGTTKADTTLIGFDVMVEQGGLL